MSGEVGLAELSRRCPSQVLQATGTQGMYNQAVQSQQSVVNFANTVRI